VQFADQSVVIDAREPWLRRCLEQHLRSCLGETQNVAAAFTLFEKVGVFEYWRDGLLCMQSNDAGDLLDPLMQDMLTRLIAPASQQLMLHAGAVALEGQGILLCGGTGCGKSTLTALLAADGFDYLTDEVVAIPLSLDVMGGFARSIVLKADPDTLWQTLAGRRHAPQTLSLPNGTTWLAPHGLGAGSVRRQVLPGLILFIRYLAGAPFEASALSPAESGFQLMQQLANARNLPRHGLSLVSVLAQRAPAYQVTYGQAADLIRWLRASVTHAG